MDDNIEDPRPPKRVKVEGSETALQDIHNSVPNSSDNMKELEVGIHTWIDGSRPMFHGLLKKRYTDFLVNEILLDGTVAHLCELRPNRGNGEVAVHDTTRVSALDGDDESNHEASGENKAMGPSSGVSTGGEATPAPGSENPATKSQEQPRGEAVKVSTLVSYDYPLLKFLGV